jgi:CheY-like chemotaxis protein
MLTELGYRVSTVGNAAEAMEVLERGQPVDVVFSDIVMPGEMNGIDLGCEIRRRWPHIKVALTSGFSEDAITRDCCGSGFVVISKPYREQELAQKLSIILEQRQSLPHQP